MDANLSDFLRRLKDVREDADISQSQAAKLFGISRDALGRYERGERIPQVDFLCKFCARFNVSADYMLGRTEIRNTPQINVSTSYVPHSSLQKLSDDQYVRLQKLADLSENSINEILDLIEFKLQREKSIAKLPKAK